MRHWLLPILALSTVLSATPASACRLPAALQPAWLFAASPEDAPADADVIHGRFTNTGPEYFAAAVEARERPMSEDHYLGSLVGVLLRPDSPPAPVFKESVVCDSTFRPGRTFAEDAWIVVRPFSWDNGQGGLQILGRRLNGEWTVD